jgi:hypothetical protein
MATGQALARRRVEGTDALGREDSGSGQRRRVAGPD